MTKYLQMLLVTAVAMLAGVSSLAQQKSSPAAIMLEAARQKETVEGDLPGAIIIYKDLVAKFGKTDRPASATALLRMAECHQKLGDAEARKVFALLVANYPDQREIVAQAQARFGATSTEAVRRHVGNTGGPMTLESVSPDGRSLLFQDFPNNNDLFIRDVNSNTDRQLTKVPNGGRIAESAWSKDGRQIAFEFQKDNRAELHVITTNGTGTPVPRTLVANPEVAHVRPYDFSPDGAWVAATLDRVDGVRQIGLVSTQGQTTRVLKSIDWPDTRTRFTLAISPDGRYLAFDRPRVDSNAVEIFVLAVDGSREVSMVSSAHQNRVIAWAPDGRSLLFSRVGPGNPYQLWSASFVEGRPGIPTLVNQPMGGRVLGVTSAGTLYFVEFPERAQPRLVIAEFDFGSGAFMPPSSDATARVVEAVVGSGARSFSFSPDGKEIAFTRDVQDRRILGIRRIDNGQTREFEPALKDFDAQRWAPDGGSLVTWASDFDGRHGIYLIDANTGAVRTVVSTTSNDTMKPLYPDPFSPDGKRLYYERNARGNSSLGRAVFEHDLVKGTDRDVLEKGTWRVSLSPDKRRLRYVDFESKEGILFDRDLATLQTTVLARGIADESFSPDGKHFVAAPFNRPGDQFRTLQLFSVAGGPSRELARMDRPAGVPDGADWGFEYTFRWAPDSQSLIVSKTVSAESAERWWIALDGRRPRRVDELSSRFAGIVPVTAVLPDQRRMVLQLGDRSPASPAQIWAIDRFFARPPR